MSEPEFYLPLRAIVDKAFAGFATTFVFQLRSGKAIDFEVEGTVMNTVALGAALTHGDGQERELARHFREVAEQRAQPLAHPVR